MTRTSGNPRETDLESAAGVLGFGKVTAAEGPEGARRGVVTPFARPQRRLRRGDERLDLAAEVDRLTRENEDLRAQLAAHSSQLVIDAALKAGARLLAVVRAEVELRIAEGRWALQKVRNESRIALAEADEELARLESLKRQLAHQTQAFAADLTALVDAKLPAPEPPASLDETLADRLRRS